tara:strand:+ start:92627 stop:94015 length:1389 start_codon:yes stop_codon:yes gene_type:complete
LIIGTIALAQPNETLRGQSAIPLLSGFDEQRIENVFPIRDEPTAGEAGKLVYRLQRIAPATLRELNTQREMKANDSESDDVKLRTDDVKLRTGDVVSMEGVIEEIGTWPIPRRLVEFLEIAELQEVLIRQSDGSGVRIITTGLVTDAAEGDRVAGIGIALSADDDATDPDSNEDDSKAVAAGRLQWFPRAASSEGVAMLTDKGVDAAGLADLASRDRRPLAAEDADVFYPVMRAAAELASAQASTITTPQSVDPVPLLRDPNAYGGHWLRMTLGTVRVTRIAVTDDRRREQLGSDHYFQIDASGDLGNVVVSIARPDGDAGPPIQFENTYPVSLVTRTLPTFLRDAIVQQEGAGAITTMISRPIQVDGFFLRLWSYESDFMQRKGGGKQFGPLIVASRFTDLDPGTSDPAGVRVIGWIAAVAIILALVGTAVWARVTSSHDRRIRRKRKNQESEQLRLPTES